MVFYLFIFLPTAASRDVFRFMLHINGNPFWQQYETSLTEFQIYGTSFQKGCSIHTAPFYKHEKLDLQNRNGIGLYSPDKEINSKELCDLSLLWDAAGKEIKLLKSGDLDINSIFSQWWNIMNNEEYVEHWA